MRSTWGAGEAAEGTTPAADVPATGSILRSIMSMALAAYFLGQTRLTTSARLVMVRKMLAASSHRARRTRRKSVKLMVSRVGCRCRRQAPARTGCRPLLQARNAFGQGFGIHGGSGCGRCRHGRGRGHAAVGCRGCICARSRLLGELAQVLDFRSITHGFDFLLSELATALCRQ